MCFFGGVGVRGGRGENGPFVFMNFFVFTGFIYCLFMYLLDSIYVFLDLCTSFFRGGCCEACVCREGEGGGVVLEIKTRREGAKRMFFKE